MAPGRQNVRAAGPKEKLVKVFYGSLRNKALENEDQSMKHPNLEKGAPKLENEAPKT